MRGQFEFVVAAEPGKAAKKAKPASIAVVAVVTAVAAFNAFGTPRLPNLLGLETLGSVNYAKTDATGVKLPRWHVVELTRASLAAPVRFDRVQLRAGQSLKIAYDVEAKSGGFRLSVFRRNGFFQGISEFQHVNVEAGQARADVFTYVAPRDGVYVVSRDVRPDSAGDLWLSTLFETYDVAYAVTWSIERPRPQVAAADVAVDDAAERTLPLLRR